MSSTATDFAALVTDWGGFELLVADLHRDGHVTVERDKKLRDRFGVERQIDVYIERQERFLKTCIICECKFWSTPVKMEHVDRLATVVQDLGAAKGVIFTTKGFQSGAIEKAKNKGIELFLVRSLQDDEWGAPGRHVDFYLQLFSRSMASMTLHCEGTPPPQPRTWDDPDGPKIVRDDGSERLLWDIVEELTLKRMQEVAYKFRRIVGQDMMQIMCPLRVSMEKRPQLVGLPTRLLGFDCELCVQADQSRIQYDRAEALAAALAVESVLNDARYMATKRLDQNNFEVHSLSVNVDSSGAVKQGDVIKIMSKCWFPSSDILPEGDQFLE